MTIFQHLTRTLKEVLINKIFWIIFTICLAMLSQYILGADNFLEEIGENLLNNHFGIDIDLSPEYHDSENSTNVCNVLEGNSGAK